MLVVSGMWPSPAAPDYGTFVRTFASALAERPDVEVEVGAITTRRAGPVRTPVKYAVLAGRALSRARRADVVWGHYLVPAGAVAAGAGALARRPWVLTAHGRDVANLDRAPVRAATRAALGGAAAVTAVSQWLATRLAAGAGYRGPIEVVNMGVDLRRFCPAPRAEARRELSITADGPLVLAAGGLTERKNPLTLVRAVARLRSSGTPARLAFVGDGPLAGAVREAAAEAGIGDAVTLAGAVPADGVARWMAACDVLALVSRPEPLGVVALEALAAGRPVVVTAEGGTPEILAADPGAGEVVDPGDPGSIAAGIARVLARPPGPERCRAVAEGHDVARRAEQMATILARAAGRG